MQACEGYFGGKNTEKTAIKRVLALEIVFINIIMVNVLLLVWNLWIKNLLLFLFP